MLPGLNGYVNLLDVSVIMCLLTMVWSIPTCNCITNVQLSKSSLLSLSQ